MNFLLLPLSYLDGKLEGHRVIVVERIQHKAI